MHITLAGPGHKKPKKYKYKYTRRLHKHIHLTLSKTITHSSKRTKSTIFFLKYQISQTAETLNSKNMTGKLKKNSNIKKKEVLMNTCTNHLTLYTLGENKIRKRRQRHATTSQTRRTLCISTRERQLKKIAPGYERKVPQE